ncbi:MAG: SIMPL domain-containing protein [Micavibrio aeruginosavorus]|uniref:SIMPL domain-containing protein n=1 Tax=Micavibrio aeruginosavorus TaxID=349221 RepID=A0A2W5FMU4_9BACT|nr:MAG: SIMPL domain-containing protein [Micavibrio aeruginosavorus]
MTDNCKSSCSSILLFAGLGVIGVALAFSGFKIFEGLKYFRSYDRFVTVKGLATKDMRADLAVWSVNFTVTGNDLPQAQSQLEVNREKVTAFLKSNGLGENDIRIQSIQVADKQAQTYSSGGGDGGPRYVLSQALIARTNDVESMIKASQNVSQLIKDGVVLGQPNGGYNPAPQYMFTKLNDVKPQMIAEATKSARASAEQFAKDSGQEVGQIRSANQGVFEILPRDPNIVETETPDKTVRVVTTVEYYLAD